MTASAWQARAVHAGDAGVIAGHRYYRGEPQVDVDAYARWLAPSIAGGTYFGFVAEVNDRMVAGAGAVLLDWGPTRGDTGALRARIANVFTDEAWRQRGIARALVQAVMAACAQRGIRTFNLAASAEGTAMYRGLGFVAYENEMILRR